ASTWLKAGQLASDCRIKKYVDIFGPNEDIGVLVDDFVSAKKVRFWNFKAKWLCRSHINDEFERGRLFNRKINRPGALENFIDSFGRVPKLVRIVRSVGHKTSGYDIFP